MSEAEEKTLDDFITLVKYYSPDDVDGVPEMVTSSEDKLELWKQLINKYGPWPPDKPSTTTPEATDEDESDILLPLCSLKGRALIIGIDYTGVEQSRGCISSANQLELSFREQGFTGDIKKLVDDGSIDKLPTKDNIISAAKWLRAGARPGDTMFLYFSGRIVHGGHNEREGSGLLYPADYRKSGHIRGTEIIRSIDAEVPHGCQLLILSDARPGGYTIAKFSHQLISFIESDFTPRNVVGQHSEFKNIQVSQISIHRPRLAEQHHDLAQLFCQTLSSLRKPKEDYSDQVQAKDRFLAMQQERYSNVDSESELISKDTPARYLANWATCSVSELMKTLGERGIPPRRVPIIQNMIRTCFRDVGKTPYELIKAPSLRSVLHGIRDAMHSGSVAPQIDTTHPLAEMLEKPVLPYPVGWQTFGIFPHHTMNSRLHKVIEESSQPRDASLWKPKIGFISSADDILQSPHLCTLAEAISTAESNRECVAFCFKGENPVPGEKIQVFFKSKFDLQGRGWVTYSREDSTVGDRWEPPVNKNNMESQLSGLLWRGRPTANPTTPHPHIGKSEVRGAVADRLLVSPHHRLQLSNFYQYYNNKKLPSVVGTLIEWRGREDKLFDSLISKYGPFPPINNTPLPVGWREAESPAGDIFYKHVDGRKQWVRPNHEITGSV